MGSLRMLFYVVECFPVYLEDLAADAEGAKIGDDLAKLGTLVFDGLLEGSEAGDGLFGRGGDTAAENVQLDLDAEKGLENPIVKVARDAATLRFDGPGDLH